MDGINPLRLQRIYGVPIGGIGSGTIGRGFKGEFCRFQLFPGMYENRTVKSDVFIVCVRSNGETVYQQVLSHRKPKKTLSAWTWGFPGQDATYTGLFPQAWTEYTLKPIGLKLICWQTSPVIPNNYQDSCLPVSVFTWEVINESSTEVQVSIAFAFKNGTGSRRDASGGRWNEPFSIDDGAVSGVLMHQTVRNIPCTVGIAAHKKDGVGVSHTTSFDPMGTGQTLWDALKHDGHLSGSSESSEKTMKRQQVASAVCAQVTVPPSEHRQLDFCLVWDMPKVSFRACPDVTFTKRYTRWFGSDGKASAKLASHALKNVTMWRSMIDEWQRPILENDSLPDWYKSALFNELYFVSDGGSLWIENTPNKEGCQVYPNDTRPEFGKFAYLEGHEYRMYNTYDVHFYASFALVKLWPKLQLSLQYDFADIILSEDLRTHKYLMKGQRGARKIRNSVPHDIGDPEEAPWEMTNSYCIEDCNEWKDLNLKFVLQVYRDYLTTKDEQYLASMWPITQVLMNKSSTWDLDDDGLIENSGIADQTFDTWFMTGASAYCGGLWLAALFVMTRMGRQLGFDDEAIRYEEISEKGKRSFQEKLWTGKYYRFDCSTNSWSDSIMADQLCGHWYLRACGHTYEVFPKDNVLTALETIYQFNVKGFSDGKMGAVNGMRPNGTPDRCTIQAEESWTGITYALAATMLYEGLVKEGFATAEGTYRSVYEQLGMAYQTPEALFCEKQFRSLGYMRPLSIWSMQAALESKQ